jgi:hypothetical protein
MECLIQYLDELEDLFFAIALVTERIRRTLQAILILSLLAVVSACGVVLALNAPRFALAAAFLFGSILLYGAATGQSSRSPAS